ncbi:hypothetical protein [Streptomyces griseoflavus]|uniref:hypothetical protein n=1 Tax=Streptomyces griseoflavus TaxID=35619 RepID=UPI0033A6AB21
MIRRRWWVVLGWWTAWWAAVTALFMFLGAVTDQPIGLGGCAASAAFVIVVGEIADRFRRRFPSRRRPRR